MSPVRRSTKVNTAPGSTSRNRKDVPAADQSELMVRRFLWSVISIGTHLEDIDQIWANLLGVTEAQWLILLAIDELDGGDGVSCSDIVAKVHIHPTFVTTQTKSLEKAGFVTRGSSLTDARFVLMSLTDKARKDIAKLSAQRKALNESIFTGLDGSALRDMIDRLSVITKNAERAARRLAAEV